MTQVVPFHHRHFYQLHQHAMHFPYMFRTTLFEAESRRPRRVGCWEKGQLVQRQDPSRSALHQLGVVWTAVKLPVFVVLWTASGVLYSVQTKYVLTYLPMTWLVTFFQLSCGAVAALVLWVSGLLVTPKVALRDVLLLTPVCLAYTGGQVTTVASLGAVAVSLTYVVKSLEPVVNAFLSAFVLQQVFHPCVYFSLIPIIVAVGVSSASELTFTLYGFLMAMSSNVFNSLRNVLATKFGAGAVGDMGQDATVRQTNMFALITVMSSFMLLPTVLMFPGGLWSAPHSWEAATASGVSSRKLFVTVLSSGLCSFVMQLSSFWVLSCVQPITHSVLNVLKRIVIIFMSIFVFRDPVTMLGVVGCVATIGGVLFYVYMKNRNWK